MFVAHARGKLKNMNKKNIAFAFPESKRKCVVCGQMTSKVSNGTFAVDLDLEVLCLPCSLVAELQLRKLGIWKEGTFAFYYKDGDPSIMGKTHGHWGGKRF